MAFKTYNPKDGDNLSKEYAKTQNKGKTIESLKTAYSHAKIMDHFPTGKYTSIFAETGEYSEKNFTKNFEFGYVDWLKNAMNEKVFDFIRQECEFKSIFC